MTPDSILAKELALEAGRLLLDVRVDFGPIEAGDKQPYLELKDVGDQASQALLAQRLGAQRPGDAVLSEEAKDSEERDSADRVWIIDPLDGTKEFAQGRSDWAVQVALWEQDRFTAAAFSLPAQEPIFVTGARL